MIEYKLTRLEWKMVKLRRWVLHGMFEKKKMNKFDI